MPVSQEGFLILLHSVAPRFMRADTVKDLDIAYRCLGQANATHIKLFGKGSAEALFLMARCLSRSCALDDLEASWQDSAFGFEPKLDAALALLHGAVTGLREASARLREERDLKALRERRADAYGEIVAQADHLSRVSQFSESGSFTLKLARAKS